MNAVFLCKLDEFFHVFRGGRINDDVGKVFDYALSQTHDVNHGFAVAYLHAFEFVGCHVVLADYFGKFFELSHAETGRNLDVHDFVADVNHFLEIVVGQIELLFDEFVKSFFGTFVCRGVAPFHNGTVTFFHGGRGNPLGFEIFVRFVGHNNLLISK